MMKKTTLIWVLAYLVGIHTAFAQEIIFESDMETAEDWNVVGSGTFADGGAVWGNTDPADFGDGGYLYITELAGTGTQFYIWKALELEKNGRYTFSFDYTKSSYQKAWGEVFIGTKEPGDGDYSDGGGRGTNPMSWNNQLQSDGVFAQGHYKYTFVAPESKTFYFVIKAGTNDNGKFLLGVDNVKVEKILDAVAGFDVTPVGFVGVPVSFENTSANATDYTWSFGMDSAESDEANPTYTYTATGIYTVTLYAENATSNDEITRTIRVLEVQDETVVGGSMEDADRAYWGETGLMSGNEHSQLVWGDLPNPARSQGYKPQGFDAGGFLTVCEGWSGNTSYKIFQAVSLVEETTYEISLDYAAGDFHRAWVEVFVGEATPGNGDYTDNRVGDGLLPWKENWDGGGGDTPQKFEATFEPTKTGIYYFVIKWGCGGDDNGYFNTSVDNISLVKSPATATKSLLSSETIKMNSENNKIYISSEENLQKITIWNIAGQLISSENNHSNTFESVALSSGVYLVGINNNVYKVLVQ